MRAAAPGGNRSPKPRRAVFFDPSVPEREDSLNRAGAIGIASSIEVVVLARRLVPEHECGKGGSFADAKAIINLVEMDLHCALRNVQLASYSFVGESLRD